MKYLLSFLLVFALTISYSISQIRVEPMFWWTGMKNPELQLLCYAPKIAESEVLLKYDGVNIDQIIKTSNPNYLFINLKIEPNAKPGSFAINFVKAKKTVFSYNYELKARNEKRKPAKIDQSDALYLLMPDRFANGDTANDNISTLLDKYNRTDPYGRHGGDLKGITDHIDYFKDLGVSTLWINPVLENNMPQASYHGYAITDFYKIDERFGSNADYVKMIENLHQNGLKVVMDMVANHCGSYHWWMKDLPMANWVNDSAKYGMCNFRASTLLDPYASKFDYDKNNRGWFVPSMPDFNQENPLVAKYLIQNAIWWIEYSNIDGIRMDTQPYAEKNFMAAWAAAIEVEYPNYFIVGEAWLNKPSFVSYFMKSAKNWDGYSSNYGHVFDFPLHFALKDGLNEGSSWDKGLVRLYDILCEDYLYTNAFDLVTFPDNHDTQRFFSMINEDYGRFQQGMVFSFTTRGIPMIYYGTELLMTSDNAKGDGDKRKDFPGGWAGDQTNMFTAAGRTGKIADAYNLIQTLLKWRKENPVVQYGKLKHWVPNDNVYVYARYDEKKTVLVIMNNNEKDQVLQYERFSEILSNFKSAYDVLGQKNLSDLKNIAVKAKTAIILELK
jgi:neopullulanase